MIRRGPAAIIGGVMPLRGATLDTPVRPRSVLVEALGVGDADRAKAAWAEHFDGSERFFLKKIKERTR